jgi:hypothetical protein
MEVLMADEKSEEPATVEPEFNAEMLSAKAERFSGLSAEIAKILSELFNDLKISLDTLHAVQSAVDLKKNELKMLHDLDVSAVSLKQLIEDHRVQTENLECLIRSRRARWEEEKARLDREEKEYRDILKIQRQREEEEYRSMWAEEQLDAQKRLEEDLESVRQNCHRMQETMEKTWLEREQIIRGKELECSRLIHEIERFMLKLSMHAKPLNVPLEEKRDSTTRKFPFRIFPYSMHEA